MGVGEQVALLAVAPGSLTVILGAVQAGTRHEWLCARREPGEVIQLCHPQSMDQESPFFFNLVFRSQAHKHVR